MRSLRLIATLLAFTLAACAIDKTPSQPPKPTDDPPPQTKPQPAKKSDAPAATPVVPKRQTVNDSSVSDPEATIQGAPLSVFEKLNSRAFANSGVAQGPGPAPALRTGEQRILWKLAQTAKNDGDQDFFRDLTDNPTDLFAIESKTGKGLFHVLADHDMVDAVHALIVSGLTKNISLRDITRRYPIHYARSEAMLKELWSYNPRTAADLNSQTPLIRMAQLNSPTAVRFLSTQLCTSDSLFPLFYTQHVNDADKNGMTALHFTAILANVQAIDALLNCGDTKINVEDARKRTPLHYAASVVRDSPAAAYALVAKARERTNDDVVLKVFLDQQDENGDTALHIANRCLNVSVANLLVYYGARTDLRNAKGETALEQKSSGCPN